MVNLNFEGGEKFVELSYKFVCDEFKSFKSGSHDFEHTLRVLKMAEKIAIVERADLEVVKIAALFHDVGRDEEFRSRGKVCHARVSADVAREFLGSVGFDGLRIDEVVHCILAHRSRSTGVVFDSLEAKVLFDADKLDSLGAIGVGRLFQFAGEIGSKFHDKNVDLELTCSYSEDDTAYREFLKKVRFTFSKLLTDEGKRIGQERHKFICDFFERLNLEVDGVI